ncbi:hypothetical protein [Smaragdicoccus niigatensis]|uniref:hypothetical protein n=1 Tax=Smaragdicoccus niigatensis TaxID=359359 RepID=UPI00037CEBD1|nr:hypothetical protein [Smaragdicoccus niigatensis]
MASDDPFDNETVAAILARVVWIVNPVLDVLATFDPLGLRERTKEPDDDRELLDIPGHVLDAAAWVLNTATVPGTKAWDEMDVTARTRWWVIRVGAVNNLVVAYPAVFGAIADLLPVQAALGYGNQAIVLCAVAREYGLTDTEDQVRMLAQVLNKRVINERMTLPEAPNEPEPNWTPFVLAKTLWRIGKMVRGLSDELGKRPHPTKRYTYLGRLPYVGIVADYIGEFGALERAAADGQRWATANLPTV